MNIPDRVIVYDGQCFLCNRWLHFLPPRDADCQYFFCPRQTKMGQHLMRIHGLDPDQPSSFLYIEDGCPYIASDAVIRIMSGIGGLWRTVVVLRLLPRVLRDAIYTVISRNRYQWFGHAPNCVIPCPELRQRFVDWPEPIP
jgi:predicted DCC family thiol-disulfide oxidoreductase YuxK